MGDFEELLKKVEENLNKFKTKEQLLQNHKKTIVSELPHFSIIQKYFQNSKYTPKNSRKEIDIFLKVYNIWKNNESMHKDSFNLVPLSTSYLKKSIPGYTSRKNSKYNYAINFFFDKVIEGNSYSKLSNGYLKKEYIKTDIYTSKEKIEQMILMYIDTKDENELKKYFYQIKSKKITPKKIKKENYKDVFDQHIVEKQYKLQMPKNSKTLIREEIRRYQKIMYGGKGHIPLNKIKHIVEYYKKLLPNIVNDVLYYNTLDSESGRTFNILNQMPKTIRNMLFDHYIEIDIKNEAYSITYNAINENYLKVSEDISAFKAYALNTNKIRNILSEDAYKIISDKIMSEIGLIFSNKKTALHADIKKVVKKKLLSIFNGGRVSFSFKDVKGLKYNIDNKYRVQISEPDLAKIMTDSLNKEVQVKEYIFKKGEFINSLKDDIKIIGAEIKKKGFKNNSMFYMKVESLIFDKIKNILNSNQKKHSYIHIHDGILIPIETPYIKIKKIYDYIKSINLEANSMNEELEKLTRIGCNIDFEEKFLRGLSLEEIDKNEYLQQIYRRMEFKNYKPKKKKSNIINTSKLDNIYKFIYIFSVTKFNTKTSNHFYIIPYKIFYPPLK